MDTNLNTDRIICICLDPRGRSKYTKLKNYWEKWKVIEMWRLIVEIVKPSPIIPEIEFFKKLLSCFNK